MSVLQIRDALLTVLLNDTHHFRAPEGSTKYIVWQESAEADSEWADNTLDHQVITGLAEYFTPDEYDPNVDKIQKALSDADISFRLTDIEYIDETKSTHYTWQWSVICELGGFYG